MNRLNSASVTSNVSIQYEVIATAGKAANGTFPIGMNLEGAIVGYALDANLLFHAFLRTSEGKIFAFVGPDSCDTGIPTGCYGNEVTAINVRGTSVGNFMDNSGNFDHGNVH